VGLGRDGKMRLIVGVSMLLVFASFVSIGTGTGLHVSGNRSKTNSTYLEPHPPEMIILSPQNLTYYSNAVPLTFEVDQSTSWIGYSLDNESNVTITGNTIINVGDGTHQLIAYANETSGLIGSSQIVSFAVNSSFHDPWKTSFIGPGGFPITDFAVYDGRLYALSNKALYMYNESSWNVIAAPAYVLSAIPYGNKLIVGGEGGLYSYNGTAFTLIFSVQTYIKPLGVYSNRLYAGTVLGKPPTLYFCNGSADNPGDWHVDAGFSAILNFSGPFGSIDSFAVLSMWEVTYNMYVTSGDTVYCYNGDSWSVAQIYDDVCAIPDMEVFGSLWNMKLYLVTRDQNRIPAYLGGSGFSGVLSEYNWTTWTTLLGHDYWLYSLGVYEGRLYIGTANRIYTYNGSNWDVSFFASEGAYHALSFTVFNNELYAGMGNGHIFVDPVPLEVISEKDTVPELAFNLVSSIFLVLSLLSAIVAKNMDLWANLNLSAR
jgi:hypothetical protein